MSKGVIFLIVEFVGRERILIIVPKVVVIVSSSDSLQGVGTRCRCMTIFYRAYEEKFFKFIEFRIRESGMLFKNRICVGFIFIACSNSKCLFRCL
jgi:hypothetical protein